MRRVADAVVDFVVGDDLWVAAGVLLLLCLAAVVVHLGGDPWWVLAGGVPVALWVSLRRASRAVRRKGSA